MCASTIRVVPRLTSPLSQGRGFIFYSEFFFPLHLLPLPLGEVSERSEDGEGKQ